MRPPLLVLGLAGCAAGPNAETVIDELRVVAAVAEPPAVAPGEGFALTVVVADPLAEGGDLLVWSCVPGVGCGTALSPLDERTVVPLVAAGPLPVWMLACAPGLCGDLAAVGDRILQDPTPWLQELPLSGVSAAVRTTRIAEAGSEAANPELVEVPEGPIAAAPGEEVALSFVAPGAATAWGLATTGGFTRPSEDVASDGAVTVRWVGGPDRGAGRIHVVLEDGEGGTAVWSADAETR